MPEYIPEIEYVLLVSGNCYLQQITASLGESNTIDLSSRFWKSDVWSEPHGVSGAMRLLEALRENLLAYPFWLMAPSSIFKASNDWLSPPHVASLWPPLSCPPPPHS